MVQDLRPCLVKLGTEGRVLEPRMQRMVGDTSGLGGLPDAWTGQERRNRFVLFVLFFGWTCHFVWKILRESAPARYDDSTVPSRVLLIDARLRRILLSP